jgi:Peroxidase
MACSKHFLLSLTTLSLYFSVSLAFFPGQNTHFMGPGFPNVAHPLMGLCPEYYRFTCPQADEIVISVLKEAISKDPRIAASLLRLHFHDCFVQVMMSDVSHCNCKLLKCLLSLWFCTGSKGARIIALNKSLQSVSFALFHSLI